MPLADGQAFAGYTIARVIGAGAMGEVYLADHPRLPRQDALKVLGAAVSADEEYRQRFLLEAEMAAGLRHPHLVHIYDRGDFGGQLWIAMEFVDGTDGARLLSAGHRRGIPPAELVPVVTGIAAALDYAHSRGILHRDIKPANILMGLPGPEGRRSLLADFGVARWIDRANNLTGVDMTVGTVNYAAPEQLRGEEIDGRADQYALAATAYHMLTGSAPFSDANPAVVISRHLSDPPPAFDRPDLMVFGPVFTRALAKQPADRFADCRAFAAALQEALAVSEGAPRHRKTGSHPRRGRVVAAAVGILVTAGALAGAVGLASQRREPPAASPPPPAVSARMDLPVVVMGADCGVLGAAAVTESGAPAYCARQDSQSPDSVWSALPERLRTAIPRP